MRETNILEYKGFYTRIHFSIEDGVWYGKIENIYGLVTFESDSYFDMERQFHLAVNDYIDFKKEIAYE